MSLLLAFTSSCFTPICYNNIFPQILNRIQNTAVQSEAWHHSAFCATINSSSGTNDWTNSGEGRDSRAMIFLRVDSVLLLPDVTGLAGCSKAKSYPQSSKYRYFTLPETFVNNSWTTLLAKMARFCSFGGDVSQTKKLGQVGIALHQNNINRKEDGCSFSTTVISVTRRCAVAQVTTCLWWM